jgi:hypothetical protein
MVGTNTMAEAVRVSKGQSATECIDTPKIQISYSLFE